MLHDQKHVCTWTSKLHPWDTHEHSKTLKWCCHCRTFPILQLSILRVTVHPETVHYTVSGPDLVTAAVHALFLQPDWDFTASVATSCRHADLSLERRRFHSRPVLLLTGCKFVKVYCISQSVTKICLVPLIWVLYSVPVWFLHYRVCPKFWLLLYLVTFLCFSICLLPSPSLFPKSSAMSIIVSSLPIGHFLYPT